MKNKQFSPNFIFALDWLQYRLAECCQKLSVPPPYSEPIILGDYRVNSLAKITRLTCDRLPDSEDALRCHLESYLSALQQYSDETRQWRSIIDRKEIFYDKDRTAQQTIDITQRSQGKPILIPENCVYFHENDAEIHVNFFCQKFGGKSSAGILHQKKSTNSDISIVSNKMFQEIYKQAYRIQGGSLWLNQQAIDLHNIKKKEAVLWPIDFLPVQFSDRQYAMISSNQEEFLLDMFDAVNGTTFIFCGILHEWVSPDQYIARYGLPDRIPDAPVGKFYIRHMLDFVEKFRTAMEITASPFSEAVNLIKDIVCESTVPYECVKHDNTARNIVQELKSGIRPKFLHAVNEAILKIIKPMKDRHWELEFPDPAIAGRDLEHAIFEIQEQIFTNIFNIVSNNQLRSRTAHTDSPGKGIEDIAQKFFDCTVRDKVNARATAIYGLIASKGSNKTDIEIREEILKKLNPHSDPYKLDKKICVKARKIFRDAFSINFEKQKVKSSNCTKMDPVLKSILSQIADEKITKKTLCNTLGME